MQEIELMYLLTFLWSISQKRIKMQTSITKIFYSKFYVISKNTNCTTSGKEDIYVKLYQCLCSSVNLNSKTDISKTIRNRIT